jgi:uncharacterized protein (TIGR03437 family)
MKPEISSLQVMTISGKLLSCLVAAVLTASADDYPYTFVRVAGFNTPRPDGRGAFNLNVLGRPSIEGHRIVFTTVQANASLWSYDLITSKFAKLADTSTDVPGGTGVFTDFATFDSKPLLSDDTVVFLAYDSKATRPNQGLYAVPAAGGEIVRIANYNQRGPGDVPFGELDASLRQPFGGFAVHGRKAVFTVTLTDGNPGIYIANLDGSELRRIADRNVTIRISPLFDVRIWQNPWIWKGDLVFYGQTIMDPSTGYNGIFTTPVTGGLPRELLNSGHALPGNPNTNFHTRIRIPTLQMDDDVITFVADDPSAGGAPSGGDRRFRGLYRLPRRSGGAGSLNKVVDIHSQLPGMGPLLAGSFASYSLNGGRILFRAVGGPKEGFPAGEQGLFLWEDGEIRKLIATGDTLDGRIVRQVFDVSPQAMSGDRFTFLVDFAPGLAVYAAVPASEILIRSIANSASLREGVVSPGGLVSLFGDVLGPEETVLFTLDDDGRIPTALSGVRVLFNGLPAPVLAASSSQVNVIAPFALDGAASADVVIQYEDRVSPAFRVRVQAADPGLFSADGSGAGPGAISNEDGSLNSPDNPAAPNSVITLTGAGFGQTNPSSVEGTITPAENPPRLRSSATVTIGGASSTVVSQGPAPAAMAGLYQFRVRIPANAPDGNLPVRITYSNATTQDGVTVSVRK